MIWLILGRNYKNIIIFIFYIRCLNISYFLNLINYYNTVLSEISDKSNFPIKYIYNLIFFSEKTVKYGQMHTIYIYIHTYYIYIYLQLLLEVIT